SAIQYETRLNADSIKKLEELGNTVEPNYEFNRSFGSVNAVMYGEDVTLLGGADPRRDGKALGKGEIFCFDKPVVALCKLVFQHIPVFCADRIESVLLCR
ncbi:gamma-glutamyltransferase family protein, partial [[Clostridium] symbiosum]|nr:gamma-glutamyltransferase family protein [[Clostridium] symbiosum]